MQGSEAKGLQEGFFDFLREIGYEDKSIARLNLRHRFVVDAVVSDIRGARVLDLGSHDGRWPYAYASAGARNVIGIEGRADLIKKFDEFPDPATRAKVQLTSGDFIEEMRALVARGDRFDVVACLGVFYHTMHHYLMLTLMASLQPKLIIVDGTFHLAQAPMAAFVRERTDRNLNTIAQAEGQTWAPIGNISRSALILMAESLGYSVEWADWDSLPSDNRKGVFDYFGGKRHDKLNIRRFTAYLRSTRDQGSL